jgi:hypothetical protein
MAGAACSPDSVCDATLWSSNRIAAELFSATMRACTVRSSIIASRSDR